MIAFVPLDVPVSFGFSVSVSVDTLTQDVNGGIASAIAEFGHTVSLPIGMPVFDLPEGYTANAPDSFIVNNRFLPPSVDPDPTPAPEPGSLALVGLGLGLAGLLRRRRG